MKFSEFWLREWSDFNLNQQKYIDQIILSGLEVNTVEPVFGNFNNLIIGEILECYSHPKFKDVKINKINIGNNKLLNILCKYNKECDVGSKVIVATIGSKLANMNKNLEHIKINNELSEGLLCTYSELGVQGFSNEIIKLPIDAPIGNNISNYLKCKDHILDISIPFNRADCLCILGIARNIAINQSIKFKQPFIDKIIFPTITDKLPLIVKTPDACPIYLTRIIKNINLNINTPFLIKEKLRRCDLHTVNIVVDIINYVMLELGQPMHVYDLDKIYQGIIVCKTTQKENIILLNQKTIDIIPNTLVTTDYNNKILSIAGIIGAYHSSININTTKNIILECAFFKSNDIIKYTNYYNLNTDSSYRYIKGIDYNIQIKAMERVTDLLIKFCTGNPGPIESRINKKFIPSKIVINLKRKNIDHIIGHFISDQDINQIFVKLHFTVTKKIYGWKVIIPSWRFDVFCEEDLIEEIIRIYGYNLIPNIPIYTTQKKYTNDKNTYPLLHIKKILSNLGYHEIITYSFVDPKIQKILHPQQIPLILLNPISKDMSSMRLSLYSGLIQALIYNKNRQQNDIRLFEIGICFKPNKSFYLDINQELILSGIITGSCFEAHWDHLFCKKRLLDFYDIKGDVEVIFSNVNKLNKIEFKKYENNIFHPGQCAGIYYKNEFVGSFGTIHPIIEKAFNLKERTLMFEILWNKIDKYNIPKIKNISHFPSSKRDLSFIINENIAVIDIINECKKHINQDDLIDIKLLDVYKNKDILKGFKSISIRLILQNINYTFKEKEIINIINKCILALKDKFNISLRTK